jgi:Fe-S cluster biogenesis protein NfuA
MPEPSDTPIGSSDSEILRRIERVLEDRVRPDLQTDGGGIELVGMDPDRIVQVRLTGACQGCSSSIITITMRVEAVLKSAVPEIRFVEAVP